ncbi:MAG: DUF3187 family protein [candidate division NC10 bacterium]|nr:DUF3187 family protein [candidate division NC10 bacterium]
MSLTALFVALGLVLVPSIRSFADNDEDLAGSGGPLAIRNQQPLQLLFLGFDAEQATVLPKGRGDVRMALSRTNVLLQKNQGGIDATLDLEMTKIGMNFAYGIGHRVELGLELPFYYISGGFLDKTIRGVERAFAAEAKLRRNREEFPDFSVTFDVRKDGIPLFDNNDHVLSPGDLVLRAKGEILKEEKYFPAVTGRVGIKIPTGDADLAFGSGEPDLGAGVILEKGVGPLIFYVNGNLIVPFKPERFSGLDFGPFFSGAVAAEYRLSRRLSAVLQLDAATRPFRHMGNKIFDQELLEVLVGMNVGLARNLSWQLGAAEDVFNSPGADADVTVFTNLGYRF